ncbi:MULTISPECIES: polysaccharide biosynthesis/export family protein [unclassified Sphingomonas]|uniref:polysaccharide biosynthesis/export family protein n=1 Tax=unclassified Sphingomonas TaxID=196159 RepID=UPI00269501A1
MSRTKEGLDSSIRIVDVDQMAATRLARVEPPQSLAAYFGDPIYTTSVVGRGDVLDVSIWEAPPAALFGTSTSEARLTSSTPPITTARPAVLPEMMVDQEGRINVPFAGSLLVAGKTATQVAADIKGRLAGKANQPQVLVRVVRNASSNATVVGDVVNSGSVPLTAKGERLLDALAAAGGVRQPVGKMTIQVARGDRIAVESLSQIIRDPRENIRLQPGDVVTALFQPFSFTVLGATKKNEEIPFEATGLTLAQALGRVGGLDDMRADTRGVFIFRLENPAALGLTPDTPVQLTAEGKVPVIYRIDMKNPETFFVAQSFPVRDRDVLYVSNAPIAEFQKFVTAISGAILPFATVRAVIP